jgi:hypothetical protein
MRELELNYAFSGVVYGDKSVNYARRVLVVGGGLLPTPMLKEIGIIVETKYGTA